jgi:hypothetical protein
MRRAPRINGESRSIAGARAAHFSFLALFLFDGLARGAAKQMFVSKSQVAIELI